MKKSKFANVVFAMITSKGLNTEDRFIFRKNRIYKGGVIDFARERLPKKSKYKIKKVKAAGRGHNTIEPKYREKAAKIVQGWWRERKYNKKMCQIIKIQSTFRGRLARKIVYETRFKRSKEKAESVYKELKLNNIYIDKKEIIALIIEKNFDTLEVQNWIDQKVEEQNKEKAEKIYDELSILKEVDFSKSNKEEVVNKIIELKFDEDEIKKMFKKFDEEKAMNELLAYLKENYRITDYVKEDVVIAKIRELNYDKDKIKEWADNILMCIGIK